MVFDALWIGGTVLVWYLVGFKVRRIHQIDVTRQAIFEIRDELFLEAAERGLLDEPAYRRARDIINASIRFTHRLTLVRIAFGMRVPTPALDEAGQRLEALLNEEMNNLRPNDRRLIELSLSKAYLCLLDHIIKSSWCASATLFVINGLNVAKEEIKKKSKQYVDEMKVELFEEAATLRATCLTA